MVVDMLRSAYSTTVRPWRDRPDVQVRVYWFEADDAARDLPFDCQFSSLNWTQDGIWPGVGEVPDAPRKWRLPIWGVSFSGISACGTADDWKRGGVFPEGCPLGDDGYPASCGALGAGEAACGSSLGAQIAAVPPPVPVVACGLLSGCSIGDISVFSGAKAERTTNAAGLGALTPIPFEGTLYDTDAYWSSITPHLLTVPEDGWYHVGATVQATPDSSPPSDGFRPALAIIGPSGLAIAGTRSPFLDAADTPCIFNVSTDWECDAGDAFSLRVGNAGDTTVTAWTAQGGSDGRCTFWIHRIR